MGHPRLLPEVAVHIPLYRCEKRIRQGLKGKDARAKCSGDEGEGGYSVVVVDGVDVRVVDAVMGD